MNEQFVLNRREALLAGIAAAAPALAASDKTPKIRLGAHSVSRLIVGGNPISGNSHIDARASRAMTDYFTALRVKQLLSRCEEAGIDTWQSRGDRHIVRL